MTAVAAGIVGAVIGLEFSPRHAVAHAGPISTPPLSRPSVADPSPPQIAPVPPPAITLGLSQSELALNLGNWSYDRQNWPSAIAYYNAAIQRGIDNPDIRTDLGNAYRFDNQLQTALGEYAAAQKQNPNHENSLFNQGGVYAILGKPDKAVAIWEEYLRRFPRGSHIDDAHELIDETRAHAGLSPRGG